MRAFAALLVLMATVACGSECSAQTVGNDGQFDPNNAAAVVASLRAPAEPSVPDRVRQELRKTDELGSLFRDTIDVCDGREQADGGWIKSRSEACNKIGSALSIWAHDPSAAVPYYLKACRVGVDANESNAAYLCTNATDLHDILSVSQRRSIWLDCHTTHCLLLLAGSLLDDEPKDSRAAAQYAKQACDEASPEGNGRFITGACQLAQHLGSVQDISGELAQAQQQNEDYHQKIANQNARYERQNQELDQQMANNAAMVDAVTHNGNLIAETANRQTAAVLAIGNASAVRAIPPAPQRQTSQAPAARNAPSAQSSNSASGGPGTPRNVTSVNSVSGGNPASDPNQYADALSNTCVGNFWDPKFYGWWSFQNNCGQAIHLQFFAANGAGVFGGGGAADIAAGGSANIGQSPAEVTAAGGGYVVYVCPEGYVAADSNGRIVSGPGQSYRCKKW